MNGGDGRSGGIVVDRVTKSFRTHKTVVPALASVSMTVPAGSWTTVIGPSGCGKTTLLRILAGLILPDTGAVRTEPVAYLPQADTLLPWRTALENAVLAAEIDRRPLGAARDEARDLFNRFGLSGFERVHPARLSGGMRQRVALVRTFLAHRGVLLLDEPLGALDPLTRISLQKWLLCVWSELRRTVLLVTHDVEEALVLSDQIIVLSRRPASVDGSFPLDAPRPRARTDPEIVAQKAAILERLVGGTP